MCLALVFISSHLSSLPPSSSLLRFSSSSCLGVRRGVCRLLLGGPFSSVFASAFLFGACRCVRRPSLFGVRDRRLGHRCTLVNSAGVALFVSAVAPFPSCGSARTLPSTPLFWGSCSSAGVWVVRRHHPPCGCPFRLLGRPVLFFCSGSGVFRPPPGGAVFVCRDRGLQKLIPRGFDF